MFLQELRRQEIEAKEAIEREKKLAAKEQKHRDKEFENLSVKDIRRWVAGRDG